MTHTHIIKNVLPGSIAEELEISEGDKLLAINDQEIEDVFDYHFLANEEYLTVLIEKPDGEQWELEIEKEYAEDLGIDFEQGLMDEYRSCRNKCIFCFIDQMPKDMRETLYFKDDEDVYKRQIAGRGVTRGSRRDDGLQMKWHVSNGNESPIPDLPGDYRYSRGRSARINEYSGQL